jgi:hypothetical protein
MGQRCYFSYCQLAKQTWIVEFTIDIFTGMGSLLGWALGLCTYRTPLEPALADMGRRVSAADSISRNVLQTMVLAILNVRLFFFLKNKCSLLYSENKGSA